jgi:hypothetical protein
MRKQYFLQQILFGLVIGSHLCCGGMARAATVTFDGGVLTNILPNLSTYTESGLQFAIYGVAPDFVVNGGGHALQINLDNDIIITRVGGGPFSLDSFDFLGGGDTIMGGYHGNFVSGGLNNHAGADVTVHLTGLGALVHPVLGDAAWGNVDAIDWCGYCISGFDPQNAIDNLSFSIPVASTPIPAAAPLFASGLGILGVLISRRRRCARRVTIK